VRSELRDDVKDNEDVMGPTAADKAAKAPQNEVASNGVRVLIVDDERGIRALCTDLLRRAGYDTEAVDSPGAALARLDENTFDVVVMDINMPVMNGVELCRRVRARYALPVVLITGCPSIDTAVRGIREGASEYLVKPFTPEQLRDVVGRALGGSSSV
jgi:DNA-binding NtrC family response regulator